MPTSESMKDLDELAEVMLAIFVALLRGIS
jgi:hypothetical protein